MAGKKGRSGAKPKSFYERVDFILDTVALPKVEAYLRNHSAADPRYLGYFQALLRARESVTAQRILHEHSGTVEFTAAAQAFESRMDRLATRLGTAAMPEWPERA